MTDYECQAAERFIKIYLARELSGDSTKTLTELMFAAYEESARAHNAELKRFVNQMQKILADLRWARLNDNNEHTPIIQKLERELSVYPQHLSEFPLTFS